MTLLGSSSSMFLLLVLSFLATLATAANQVCPLCATAADLPVRWDFRIQDGRTCRDLYLYLGGMSPSNSMCQATKDLAQELCCGSAEPQGYNFPPTNPPVYTGPVGSEPMCPICGTMEYPGIPQAFIVARYVGEFTCDQLYGRGLNGMTPDFMCGPLQDFAKPVCGCGEYNPKCRSNPSQCWGSSGSSPVASPVQRPVQPPVQQPVASPTAYVAPGSFNRKTPPEGGKYSTKLSNGRGGAASVLRGGRRGEEDEMFEVEDVESLPEDAEGLEFEFRVVERDDGEESSH